MTVERVLDPRERRVIPQSNGVNGVVLDGPDPPDFAAVSPAGWWEGRDPTFPIAELAQRWVSSATVVYMGMATKTERTDLRERVRKLVRYGTGHRIGHEGGRALWQLPNSRSLLIAWQRSPDADQASREERRLIVEDEYQDLNRAEQELIDQLSADGGLAVIGTTIGARTSTFSRSRRGPSRPASRWDAESVSARSVQPVASVRPTMPPSVRRPSRVGASSRPRDGEKLQPRSRRRAAAAFASVRALPYGSMNPSPMCRFWMVGVNGVVCILR